MVMFFMNIKFKRVVESRNCLLTKQYDANCRKSGTATRAQMANRAVAGKTGTTSNNVDAWFVLYY